MNNSRNPERGLKQIKPMTFYHGTSTISESEYRLLPPSISGIIQEKGRLKNLNMVFFTPDLGTAKIYAGRSMNQNGGTKRIFRVIPMSEIIKINELTYCCEFAFIEILYDN